MREKNTRLSFFSTPCSLSLCALSRAAQGGQGRGTPPWPPTRPALQRCAARPGGVGGGERALSLSMHALGRRRARAFSQPSLSLPRPVPPPLAPPGHPPPAHRAAISGPCWRTTPPRPRPRPPARTPPSPRPAPPHPPARPWSSLTCGGGRPPGPCAGPSPPTRPVAGRGGT